MSDVGSYPFTTGKAPRPQARPGAGRRPVANPFMDAARAIVNAVDGDGDAVSAIIEFTLDDEHGETLDQRKRRDRRLLTRAGKVLASEDGAPEPYCFPMDVKEAGSPGAYVLTFWHRVSRKAS